MQGAHLLCRYDVLIDGESKKSGSIFDDFEPPFNPPAEIDDPDDKKPEDWVDSPTCGAAAVCRVRIAVFVLAATRRWVLQDAWVTGTQ